jgi:hypothetical protein
MAIGANFLASIGLLNNSVLLANLCSKLGTQCGSYEKPIVAFVCLSSGFLMLQVPPCHKSPIAPPSRHLQPPSLPSLGCPSLADNPFPVLIALA